MDLIGTINRNLLDLGAGLTMAAAILSLFFIAKKVYHISDLVKIMGIRKSSIIYLSNIIWWTLIPANWYYYTHRYNRGDYPPHADSYVIGIMGMAYFTILFFPPLNLFLWLSMRKSILPAKIFTKPTHYTGIALIWEIIFVLCLLLNLLVLVLTIIDGDHFTIPIIMFFTYTLLVLRGGKIAFLKSV
ncbi:MAG: hypothetical protein AAF518_02295 [Spirochaetota bacterium]